MAKLLENNDSKQMMGEKEVLNIIEAMKMPIGTEFKVIFII